MNEGRSASELALLERNKNLLHKPPNTPPSPSSKSVKLKRRELPKTKEELPMPISTPYAPKSRTLPKVGIAVGTFVFILLFVMLLFDPTD